MTIHIFDHEAKRPYRKQQHFLALAWRKQTTKNTLDI